MKEIDLFPLFLSLKVASVATLITIIIGLTIAYLLARYRFYGRDVLDSLIMLPMVLPPTVLGYYLLVTVGRGSFLGRFLEDILGITLIFDWKGAALAASIVSLPLLVKSARASFESVDANLENMARTLGRSELGVLFSVTIPLAWRGIVAGTILAFLRALGEFGATLMVAGNIPGKTQTMPIAIYDAVQADKMAMANILVIIMTVAAISILLVMGRMMRVSNTH